MTDVSRPTVTAAAELFRVDTPDEVEAEPTGPQPAVSHPWWRRFGWAVAGVPTVAAVAFTRLAATVPEWVAMAASAGLVATAVLALVRYRDDRQAARRASQWTALCAAPHRATGTVIVTPTRERSGRAHNGGGRKLRGSLSFSTAAGTVEIRRWTLEPVGDRPPPRTGDPVAIWSTADADLVIARYQREWADAIMREMSDG